jgi:hypothetical protein
MSFVSDNHNKYKRCNDRDRCFYHCGNHHDQYNDDDNYSCGYDDDD